MRFLADENLELAIVEILRDEGHDVATVTSEGPGTADHHLLARSLEQHRILVTNDKDFAELTFLQKRTAVGIVLVRLAGYSPGEKAMRVLEVVKERGELLPGAMTVIERDLTRRRTLPRGHDQP